MISKPGRTEKKQSNKDFCLPPVYKSVNILSQKNVLFMTTVRSVNHFRHQAQAINKTMTSFLLFISTYQNKELLRE